MSSESGYWVQIAWPTFFSLPSTTSRSWPNSLFLYLWRLANSSMRNSSNLISPFSMGDHVTIYIKYIWFGLVGFYGISTIVGYLMPNPLYTYELNINDLVLWHINHYRLFNKKSCLNIYIKYIGFGLIGFYGISTIVGDLMPNPHYTYILNIYDLVWLGFMAYQPL